VIRIAILRSGDPAKARELVEDLYEVAVYEDNQIILGRKCPPNVHSFFEQNSQRKEDGMFWLGDINLHDLLEILRKIASSFRVEFIE